MLYLDTSAAAKLLVDEVESEVLGRYLDHEVSTGTTLVACLLLETELRRLAARQGVSQTAAGAVLARVDLYEMAPSLFHEAGILPGSTLRSLDALHLAAAVRLGVRSMVTYDDRLSTAAKSVGVSVVRPG